MRRSRRRAGLDPEYDQTGEQVSPSPRRSKRGNPGTGDVPKAKRPRHKAPVKQRAPKHPSPVDIAANILNKLQPFFDEHYRSRTADTDTKYHDAVIAKLTQSKALSFKLPRNASWKGYKIASTSLSNELNKIKTRYVWFVRALQALNKTRRAHSADIHTALNTIEQNVESLKTYFKKFFINKGQQVVDRIFLEVKKTIRTVRASLPESLSSSDSSDEASSDNDSSSTERDEKSLMRKSLEHPAIQTFVNLEQFLTKLQVQVTGETGETNRRHDGLLLYTFTIYLGLSERDRRSLRGQYFLGRLKEMHLQNLAQRITNTYMPDSNLRLSGENLLTDEKSANKLRWAQHILRDEVRRGWDQTPEQHATAILKALAYFHVCNPADKNSKAGQQVFRTLTEGHDAFSKLTREIGRIFPDASLSDAAQAQYDSTAESPLTPPPQPSPPLPLSVHRRRPGTPRPHMQAPPPRPSSYPAASGGQHPGYKTPPPVAWAGDNRYGMYGVPSPRPQPPAYVETALAAYGHPGYSHPGYEHPGHGHAPSYGSPRHAYPGYMGPSHYGSSLRYAYPRSYGSGRETPPAQMDGRPVRAYGSPLPLPPGVRVVTAQWPLPPAAQPERSSSRRSSVERQASGEPQRLEGVLPASQESSPAPSGLRG